MLKLFEKLFASSTISTTSIAQSEREAIIDLLLMAIYADNHISLDESQALEDSIDGLGWESGTGLSMYINDATNKVRDAQVDEATSKDFIENIATRLDSKASKEKALSLLIALFDADGTSIEEASFYKQIEYKLLPPS